jgi:AraC family transcriptional regulator
MLTNAPSADPTFGGPFDRNTPRAQQAAILLSLDGRAGARERRDRRTDRQLHRMPDRPMVDVTDHAVEISPSDVVKRRTATWPGMAAEIVQATRPERMETRFCAPVHVLAAYERGVRHDGETRVDGLPKSTLRDLGRKLVFVPAGHEYYDWQEPRILPRVVYFYFDPAGLALSPELGFAETSFAPRLFFENAALWDTALKLTTVIESAGSDHRLYVEALGVVLAHELVRLNAGTPGAQPQARGGLAAWQQRTVVAYIEEHLDEPISLATLARLVRLSPYYFCRAFKQSFGVPPHRYHTSRRIEHAKTLLAKPAPSVTDIGFTVGFSQTSSFTAAFRKATGLTPTAYHRSLS